MAIKTEIKKLNSGQLTNLPPKLLEVIIILQVEKMSLDPSKKRTNRVQVSAKTVDKPSGTSASSHATNGANYVINNPNIPSNTETIKAPKVTD